MTNSIGALPIGNQALWKFGSLLLQWQYGLGTVGFSSAKGLEGEALLTCLLIIQTCHQGNSPNPNSAKNAAQKERYDEPRQLHIVFILWNSIFEI